MQPQVKLRTHQLLPHALQFTARELNIASSIWKIAVWCIDSLKLLGRSELDHFIAKLSRNIDHFLIEYSIRTAAKNQRTFYTFRRWFRFLRTCVSHFEMDGNFMSFPFKIIWCRKHCKTIPNALNSDLSYFLFAADFHTQKCNRVRWQTVKSHACLTPIFREMQTFTVTLDRSNTYSLWKNDYKTCCPNNEIDSLYSIIFCFHSAYHQVEQMNELLSRVTRRHLEYNALACLRIPRVFFSVQNMQFELLTNWENKKCNNSVAKFHSIWNALGN